MVSRDHGVLGLEIPPHTPTSYLISWHWYELSGNFSAKQEQELFPENKTENKYEIT